MTRFIMAGRLQAAGFIIAFALLPLLGLFSNAAIALVSLRKGWQEGILLTLIGSVAVAIFTYINRQDMAFGFYLALTQWMPIVLLAWVWQQTVSLKVTFQTLLAISVAGVLLLHAMIPDAGEFWLNLFKETFKEAKLDPEKVANLKSLEDNIEKAAPLIAGVIVTISSIVMAVSLLMGRSWQAQLYNPDGFGEEFRALRFDKIVAIGTLIVVIIALATSNNLAIELLMCATVIFLFQGIALIHALVKQLGMSQTWLIVMYILLVLLNFRMAVLLASIGIIDSFVNFRQKFIKR